jgi:hypothetical protein
MLYPEPLKAEFLKIISKESKLPSRDRAWISSFMDYCIANTAILLKQQEATKV